MSTPYSISPDYLTARKRFLAAAKRCNADISSFQNTESLGIQNEDLFMDVATIGNEEARKCIVVTSGVHGIEGYCGSMLQEAIMTSSLTEALPSDTKLMLVHAVNPCGFSHYRRTNENNVDLNRNFVDFDSVKEPSEECQTLIATVFPDDWRSSNLSEIFVNQRKYIDLHDIETYQRHLTGGQYQHENQLFFGGFAPSWSRKVWEQICAELAQTSDFVAHLDIHTGLGSFGACEIIFGGSEIESNIALAKAWFGEYDVKVPASGESLSANVSGTLASNLNRYMQNVIAVGIEFGTVPLNEMLDCLIEDNWLAQNPAAPESRKREIRDGMKRSFYSNDSVWIQSVWNETQKRFSQTIEGLASV